MFTSISVTGYAPSNVNHCPECGSSGFPHTTYHSDGRMECENCGLVCYIVEAEESHRDKGGGDDDNA